MQLKISLINFTNYSEKSAKRHFSPGSIISLPDLNKSAKIKNILYQLSKP
jgi:hypothetical protein